MIVNPSTISWQAPDTDEAGEPIDYELDYELGVVDSDTGVVTPLMTLPYALTNDGRFEAPLADTSLGSGEHVVALRSVRRDLPELKSVWSDPVRFLNAERPNPPLVLKVS